MITGCSVTGQCDCHLSGAVVRPQSLPQAVAGPLSRKGLHIYIYTVQLLVLRRRFINHYSFNSILYFMKKGHSMSGCYFSECLLATKNWSFKLFSFLSLHVKHFEFCWYAFIL